MTDRSVPETSNAADSGTTAEIARLLDQGDHAAALQRMASVFLQRGDYDRLFEVRKMQSRLRLELPLVYSRRPEGLTGEKQLDLERELSDAALECGQLLANAGNFRQAWTYLGAVDNGDAVRRILDQAPCTADNVHDAIEICLHQNAHPLLGMKLAVEHLGTCSSITLFDSVHQLLDGPGLAGTAAVLIRHLHDEISATAAQRMGLEGDVGLQAMIAGHGIALARNSPHADPSHLHGILRIGRTQTTPEMIDMLWTLSRYCGMLPESLQYPGDPPFAATALHHQWWYGSQAGHNVEQALQHFCTDLQRYENPGQQSLAREYGVLLLWQLKRFVEAVQLALSAPADSEHPPYAAHGIGPHLIEMASLPATRELVCRHYAATGDLLGFAVTRML